MNLCYNTVMNELILIVYGEQYVFQDKSLKVLAKHAIQVLEKVETGHAKQAIKLLKISRFFFRIDPDAKISCSLTKLR